MMQAPSCTTENSKILYAWLATVTSLAYIHKPDPHCTRKPENGVFTLNLRYAGSLTIIEYMKFPKNPQGSSERGNPFRPMYVPSDTLNPGLATSSPSRTLRGSAALTLCKTVQSSRFQGWAGYVVVKCCRALGIGSKIFFLSKVPDPPSSGPNMYPPTVGTGHYGHYRNLLVGRKHRHPLRTVRLVIGWAPVNLTVSP